jgi:bla regulator protein blaR1
MIPLLMSHLWQSTFFAIVAGLLTVAFRGNRAQIRYWLWLSASLKFFVPFALLVGLGSHLENSATRQIATRITTAPAIAYTMEQFGGPLLPERLPAAAPTTGTIPWIPFAIAGLWLLGFLAIVLVRFRNWLRVRTAVLTSSPISIPATVEVRVSPGLLEPGLR